MYFLLEITIQTQGCFAFNPHFLQSFREKTQELNLALEL